MEHSACLPVAVVQRFDVADRVARAGRHNRPRQSERRAAVSYSGAPAFEYEEFLYIKHMHKYSSVLRHAKAVVTLPASSRGPRQVERGMFQDLIIRVLATERPAAPAAFCILPCQVYRRTSGRLLQLKRIRHEPAGAAPQAASLAYRAALRML